MFVRLTAGGGIEITGDDDGPFARDVFDALSHELRGFSAGVLALVIPVRVEEEDGFAIRFLVAKLSPRANPRQRRVPPLAAGFVGFLAQPERSLVNLFKPLASKQHCGALPFLFPIITRSAKHLI